MEPLCQRAAIFVFTRTASARVARGGPGQPGQAGQAGQPGGWVAGWLDGGLGQAGRHPPFRCRPSGGMLEAMPPPV
ncbi:MAG: hypothetical protein ACLP5E_29500 [Streptosporangiaceae bacterium]